MDYNITYERSIYKSYMKMDAIKMENMDEKILLMKQIDGLLSMERNFFNGEGQYWYDISGKQALDQFCKTNKIEIEFFEQLILEICNRLECFEWNLLREECLLLQPEMIFVGISDKKFYFTGYPEEKKTLGDELRSLMDFLLTKIDHSDGDVIKRVYEIYEMILQEDFFLFDLKKRILDGRTQRQQDVQIVDVVPSVLAEQEVEHEMQETDMGTTEEFKCLQGGLIEKFLKRIRGLFRNKEKHYVAREEELQDVVYPDETKNIPKETTIHPTVCLTASNGEARGILMYEGVENFKDFEIKKEMCAVGKGQQADLKIEKNTISQYHAKIEWKDGNYYIEDMNSTNGTYINEEILSYKECRLIQVGDVIRFADVKYRLW